MLYLLIEKLIILFFSALPDSRFRYSILDCINIVIRFSSFNIIISVISLNNSRLHVTAHLVKTLKRTAHPSSRSLSHEHIELGTKIHGNIP